MLDTVRVTENGQIRLPPFVCKELGIRNGDKVRFVQTEDGRITVVNATLYAFLELQKGLEGVAEELGLQSEEDVDEMMKEFRRERSEEGK